MRSLCLALSLIAFAAGGARAQSAEDYLHGAAAKYIQGRNQEAAIQVEEGLRRYPADEKLKALAGHLRNLKDQQKQDGNQGSQQGDPGDKQEEKKDGEQGGKDQEKQDQEQEKGQEEGKEDGKGKQGQEAADQGDEQGGKDSTGEAMAPVKPGEMSKEDAERLLNSVQDDEKKEHKNMQRRYRKKVEVEQDW